MLDQLFQKFRTELYSAAKRHKKGIKSSRFDTSDIAQDGLLSLWVKYQKSDSEFEANQTFLDQVSQGATANNFRFHTAEKRSLNRESRCQSGEAASSRTDPQEIVASAENFRRLLAVLTSIPPEMRRAFEMFTFNGSTYREIAEELEITSEKVRTLIKNARIEMRKRLEH